MPGFTLLSPADKETIASFLFGDAEAAGAHAAPPAETSEVPRIPYRFNGYNRFVDSKGYPAITPPWGSLTAIDLNTGEQVWRVALGEFKELTARGIPPTGTENYGGPVATAGGLLFIAATKDGMFRAFEKKTGQASLAGHAPGGRHSRPRARMRSAAGSSSSSPAGGRSSTRPRATATSPSRCRRRADYGTRSTTATDLEVSRSPSMNVNSMRSALATSRP